MKLAPIVPTRRQDPFEDPEWGCDLKLDGFRGLADTINGRLLSKNLNRLKRYARLLDALPLDCLFDGEVCALDQYGRPDFNALLFRRKEPVYIAFDLLFYEREDIRPLPLKERRSILDQVQGQSALLRDGVWREHNGRCLTCLDVEWLANSRTLRVVFPAMKVRKKLSKLALKVRTSPVRSGIITQDMLDFPQPL